MKLVERPLHLIDPLGTGDLATVYRATDPEDEDHPLAAAVIHSDLGDVDGIVAALQARVSEFESLVHPGVVSQEGMFLVSGRPTLVQEIVPGVDLIRLAKVGQVPQDIAAALIRDAAMVLDALSHDGWAHGFLSPRRTLLTVGGRVKLAGLGARAGTALVSDPLDAVDRGRMRYTAPERRGGLVDHPADVYALGAMLSLLLTGTWPKRPGRDSGSQADVVEDAVRRIGAEAGTAGDLVGLCLGFTPVGRPSLSELVSALEGAAAAPEALQAWAARLVPELAGAMLEGLEGLEGDEAALPVDEQAIDLEPAAEPEPESFSEMETFVLDEGAPLDPDDETDLAVGVDTDEPEQGKAPRIIIDENADQWDRMLGLDVVADGAAAPAAAPAAASASEIASDQVKPRSNLGLWIGLGLLLGAGMAWSLGLFAPGAESPAGLDDPPALTAPEVPPAEVPPAEVPPVESPPLEAPPAEAPPIEALPVETPSTEPPPAAPVAPLPGEAAPPPAASEEAAAPVALLTGLVRVAGDAAEVRLVRAGRRYSGGRMPPGSYLIEAVFQAGEAPRVAGKLSLEAGDKRLVRCAAAFYRCQVY